MLSPFWRHGERRTLANVFGAPGGVLPLRYMTNTTADHRAATTATVAIASPFRPSDCHPRNGRRSRPGTEGGVRCADATGQRSVVQRTKPARARPYALEAAARTHASAEGQRQAPTEV